MARLARLVVPDVAHHVTQRGNRRRPVFFSDEDYEAYRDLVAGACAKHAVRCLAWCLMPNHVHLILTPSDADGLRAALAEPHRRHAGKAPRPAWRSGAGSRWPPHLFDVAFDAERPRLTFARAHRH